MFDEFNPPAAAFAAIVLVIVVMSVTSSLWHGVSLWERIAMIILAPIVTYVVADWKME